MSNGQAKIINGERATVSTDSVVLPTPFIITIPPLTLIHPKQHS
jgi:hypothetical protein